MASKLTEAVAEAQKLYDIRGVLGLSGRRKWIVCPLPQHVHHNNSPSFSFFTSPDGAQRWKCHGNCGLQGDVVDLVGYIHVPGYDPKNPADIRQALGSLDNRFVICPPQVERREALPPDAWRKYLPPGESVIHYASMRGLTVETLLKFKIGQYGHFMAMPVFEDGVLRHIKFRNIWPKERLTDVSLDTTRFWAAKGSVKALFNYDAVAYTDRPVLVLKGEIPVMLCDQLGFLACAPTSGEGSYIEQWAPLLAFASKVVVVGDNDYDPEVRQRMQARAKYRAELLKGELKFPPENYKDWDEWALADPSALEVTKSWLI